jgi:triosephosphate isomerase (TIM)
MRRPIVAGNWKMNGSRAENDRLIDAIIGALAPDPLAEIVVCPPFPYLGEVIRALRGSSIAVGAQDVCAEAVGAHTGEVSAAMLRDIGCSFVLVGHSERRSIYGESDLLVARKFAAAQTKGLVPVLCVGEQLAEREAGTTFEVVGRQLDAIVELCGVQALGTAVVAYEPVWAIGTGRTASPEQAQDVHAFIRGRIAANDANIAGSLRILYGGSVKSANAAELFSKPDVDGGLIGGASLQADEFVAIAKAART